LPRVRCSIFIPETALLSHKEGAGVNKGGAVFVFVAGLAMGNVLSHLKTNPGGIAVIQAYPTDLSLSIRCSLSRTVALGMS